MDTTTLISFIPKIAATTLVLLGILIIIEIRAMIKNNKIKQFVPSTKKDDIPVVVKFPQTTVQTVNKHEVRNTSPVSILAGMIGLLFIFVVGTAGFYYFQQKQNSNVNTPAPSPDNTIKSTPISILIYKISDDGTWMQISREELNKLQPGSGIKIAVRSQTKLSSAEFSINGNQIIANPSAISPFGDLYIDYVLPMDTTNYRIAVSVN